jgi:hypothetical protein
MLEPEIRESRRHRQGLLFQFRTSLFTPYEILLDSKEEVEGRLGRWGGGENEDGEEWIGERKGKEKVRDNDTSVLPGRESPHLGKLMILGFDDVLVLRY